MRLNLKRGDALPRAQRGFSLVEVLVTLVVVSTGLLGLGKLQAAALAESQVSRTRALMSYQAESLASAMRADPLYWAAAAAPQPNVSIATASTGATVTDNAGSLVAPPAGSCLGPGTGAGTLVCSPANIAYDDLHAWAAQFGAAFPGALALITCASGNGTTGCDVALSWNEHYVAVNRSTATAVQGAAASPTSTQGNTMVLHVLP